MVISDFTHYVTSNSRWASFISETNPILIPNVSEEDKCHTTRTLVVTVIDAEDNESLFVLGEEPKAGCYQGTYTGNSFNRSAEAANNDGPEMIMQEVNEDSPETLDLDNSMQNANAMAAGGCGSIAGKESVMMIFFGLLILFGLILHQRKEYRA